MTEPEVLEFINQNASNREIMLKIRLAADKNIKTMNATAKKDIVRKKYTPQSYAIASTLSTQVFDRYPFLKEKADLEAWAVEIEKISRLDGYAYEIVDAVMKWSQEDTFWKQQIRSGLNLRKHFDKMLIQIKSNEETRARVFKVWVTL